MYGRSEAECEAKYARALGYGEVEVRPGSISEFVVTTFAAWHESRIQPESFIRYDQVWRGQVGPMFGHLLFCELTNEIVQSGLMIGKSVSTRQLAQTLLAQIVKLAISHGLADQKHLMMVKLVRVGSRTSKPRTDMAEKAKALLSRATGTSVEGPVWCAMTLSLRLGEVCGLMPTDIDLDRELLTICRQRNSDGIKDRLKCREADEPRTVGVPRAFLEKLLTYHRPGTLFLFTGDRGRPFSYEHPERELGPFQDAQNRITFHDLRSAAVSILIDAGIDDHTIMDITGHTSAAMIRAYRDTRGSRTKEAFKRLVTTSGGD